LVAVTITWSNCLPVLSLVVCAKAEALPVTDSNRNAQCLLIIAVNFFAFLPKAVNKNGDESGRSSGLCGIRWTFPSAVADSGLKSYRSFPEEWHPQDAHETGQHLQLRG
jgi:hypothetical protein